MQIITDIQRGVISKCFFFFCDYDESYVPCAFSITEENIKNSGKSKDKGT